MLIEIAQSFMLGSVYACTFSMFFGICICLMYFCGDIQQGLNDIEKEIQENSMFKRPLQANSHLKMKHMFFELIRFHAIVKQLRIL